MKQYLKSLTFLSLSIFFITFTACDDEPLDSGLIENENQQAACQSAVQASASAAQSFTNATDDNYSVLCNSYKMALRLQITACGDANGSIQAIIDNLNCETTHTECLDAESVSLSALTAYNADPTNATLCNAYKTALQYEITVCGDADGSLQAIIDGLGDCDTNGPSTASIIGTWRIISLTSNGVEELQEELDNSGICYWEEVYTATTATDTDYSGPNCDVVEIVESYEYSISGNILSFVNGDDPLEILEITDTTLRYQDSYNDAGEDYIDIYTYERQ
ncbi:MULTISPECIES: lipocalin-like domain-containing protein [Bizionia]|uniref:Lipocalin-like domain-containing protein n=1 Tax=Bizionia algoritergicola TaxID=291187 RepID=A0A5D0QTQ1_9FLAO|nr:MULTISPECIES: lipocalin family protein [Bizionia]OBX21115.1 hypothetical protein BAA08_14110 [Bizionia sp. APA-3]TYB72239.1 hypothetical protein ES675_10745 [Bizionia algoritergicola]